MGRDRGCTGVAAADDEDAVEVAGDVEVDDGS